MCPYDEIEIWSTLYGYDDDDHDIVDDDNDDLIVVNDNHDDISIIDVNTDYNELIVKNSWAYRCYSY